MKSCDERCTTAPQEETREDAATPQSSVAGAPGVSPEAADADATLSDEELAQQAIAAGEEAFANDIKQAKDALVRENEDLKKELEGAETKLEKATAAAEAAAQKFMRLQADWDNYRRRSEKEAAAHKALAAEKLVFNLLPVLDDMERADQHSASIEHKDENFVHFIDGVRQVHDKMLAVLAKEGVEVIDPQGEAFDPMLHQAVGRKEDASVYADTVAEVYQKGYRMAHKVIREAMVSVTFGGKERPTEDEEAPSADASSKQKDANASTGDGTCADAGADAGAQTDTSDSTHA